MTPPRASRTYLNLYFDLDRAEDLQLLTLLYALPVRHRGPAIKQVLTQWRAALPMTLNGRSVNVLQGAGKEMTATLYFDVQTGLLTRVVRYANSAMGRVPTQFDYEDYREVAGVKIPFKWTFAWVSGRDVVQLTDVQANVAIDAAKFGKPAPAVAPK